MYPTDRYMRHAFQAHRLQPVHLLPPLTIDMSCLLLRFHVERLPYAQQQRSGVAIAALMGRDGRFSFSIDANIRSRQELEISLVISPRPEPRTSPTSSVMYLAIKLFIPLVETLV